jgi:hypothetical protein
MADEFEVSSLEFYTKRAEKRTLLARVLLLTSIMTMLTLNLYLTQRNHESMLINLNQTRLEQVTLDDMATADMQRVNLRLAAMEAQLEQAKVDRDLVAAAAVP